MMIRKFYCVVLASVTIMSSASGEWVSLKNGASRPAAPAVTVLQDNGSSTILRIDLSGFDVRPFQSDGKSYQSIDLLTDVATVRTGSPEVPYLAEMLAIPDRGGVTAEVIETGEVQRFAGYMLPPARPSWQEGAPEPGYIENSAAYHSAAAYPESFVSIDEPVVFRDFRIARVAIYPVRYVPETKEIQVVSSMTVSVRYGSGSESNPRTSGRRAIPHSFGTVYRSTMINYQSVLNREFGGLELGRDVLLCIVPDTFATAFKPYADWKNKTGTQVKVTKFSEIGANSTNPDIIKNYIASCYHTWQNPPTYVLLVGDYGQVPKKAADGQSFANEDYFVEIDGSDVFPEMYIGRFTQDVNSIIGLQTIINKVIKYERFPYRANQNWFRHAVACANNEWPTQPDTKRWVSDIMRTNGGFTVDTLLNLYGGPCIHNVAEIKSAINNGRSFLNYRGEGSYDGWVYATCYPFNTSDVSTLNNGEMLTFVTSIGCGVAMFDAGSNCFGEVWMELGTPSAGKGACAFCGPTWGNTHTKYNNAIDKGLYVAMFQEGVETPGPALLRGKIRMYNLYGGADPYVIWHFRAYTVLGDPSTHVWRDVPRKVNMTYTSQVSLGYDQVQVTVVDSATLAPVSGAEICIAGDSVYVTGVTDETGIAVIPVSAPMIDTLTLLVRGVRVVPAEGTIAVFSDQEHVTPFGDPTVSDLDGNHDGKINPNEHIQISYILKNWGAQPSSNVQATLSATDTTYVSIVNAGPVSYGILPPNGTGSPTGVPLQFYVKGNAPVGIHVPLHLNVTSSSHSWSYVSLEAVVGCNLLYVGTVVDDHGSPSSNGRLDPGETAIVYVTITNTGEDAAPNVAGVLRCTDPHISILDSTGSYGTIAIGGSSTNTSNYFVVSAADTCPIGLSPLFAVALSTQSGNYPYSVTREFPLTVGLPTGTDPSGPDSYGYYAYSNDDSLYEEAPLFNWVEIRSVGTRVPYVSPGDFTATETLPFVFRYYGRNFTSVRVSSDGWLAFGSGTQSSYTNYGLPHNDNVTNMVALFWDDLFEGSSNPISKLLYYSDPANHRFIVEWDSVGHYGGTTLRECFQAVLLDPAYYPTPTGDGEFILQYRMVGEEGACTIGCEDSTQTIGLQYLYNSVYAQTATEIRDGSAIKFTTKPPSFGSTNLTVSVLIGEGWNLISNPVLRPDSINAVRRLYPHAQTDYAFRFDPALGYVQSPVMPNGPGYWAKFPGGELNSITGTRLMSDSISVSAGWNIIGSISEYVDTSTIRTIPPGLRTSYFFGYNGGYSPATRLAPGHGYWVKTSSAGQFVLGSAVGLCATGIVASQSEGLEELSSITVTDSKGSSQTLYFGLDPGKKLRLPMFVMPPLPPTGAFDARFESADGGAMVRTHPGEIKDIAEFPITIQSSSYPLTVEWKIVGGGSYELIDALGGQRVPARSLSGTGAFRVSSSAVEKLILRVLSSQELPGEFALSQNYPNPFNPSTLICYALPVESRVSLRIYNVLGQEVGILVNDVQGAGYKSISWDSRTARGVQAASGVYFMRLRAEGANGAVFSDVRKLLLMK